MYGSISGVKPVAYGMAATTSIRCDVAGGSHCVWQYCHLNGSINGISVAKRNGNHV